MKINKPWDKKSTNDGSYLKYEEGQIVPVESDNPYYPPFLNEENEDGVKKFKDMNPNRTDEAPAEPQPTPSVSRTTRTQNPEPQKRQPFKIKKLIMPGIWVIILGGLAYYSVPVFQHFASETPEIATIDGVDDVKDQVTQATNEVKEVAINTSEQVKEKTQEVAGEVSQGSGLVSMAKENLSVRQSDNTTAAIQLSKEDWLNVISTTQNQKQEYLIALQTATTNLANGNTSHSAYRLNVKGITRQIERLHTQLESSVSGQNLAQTGTVVDVLDIELTDLENLSVSLSSVSERNVVDTFNTGVQEQNELTNSYRESFKSLLSTWEIKYTEKNGEIIY